MVQVQSSSNKYTIMTEGNGGILLFDLTPGTACLQTTDVVLYICVRWPCSNTEPYKIPPSRSPFPVLRLLLLQKEKGSHRGRKEGEEPWDEEEEEEGEDKEGAGCQAVAQADKQHNLTSTNFFCRNLRAFIKVALLSRRNTTQQFHHGNMLCETFQTCLDL